MKLLACVVIAFCTLSAFGQENQDKEEKVVVVKKVGEKSTNALGDYYAANLDKPLWVSDADTVGPLGKSAFFLNGKFIPQTAYVAVNEYAIDSIRGDNREVIIDGMKYMGRMQIFMKPDYTPANISLSALRVKHTLPGSPSIFYINNTLIKGDYDNFLVDENYILKIEVQKLDDAKENLHVNVIRVLTKTKENLSKAYPIRIRGVGETANNN